MRRKLEAVAQNVWVWAALGLWGLAYLVYAIIALTLALYRFIR